MNIQHTFQKMPKKYQLIKQDLKKTSQKKYLENFNWKQVASRKGNPKVNQQVAHLI